VPVVVVERRRDVALTTNSGPIKGMESLR